MTSEDLTGTNIANSNEQYRKRGMTKIDSDNHSQKAHHVHVVTNMHL